MSVIRTSLLLFSILPCTSNAFTLQTNSHNVREKILEKIKIKTRITNLYAGNIDEEESSSSFTTTTNVNIWEQLATSLILKPTSTFEEEDDGTYSNRLDLVQERDTLLNYCQTVTLLRVIIPSSVAALLAGLVYAPLAVAISHLSAFDHDGVYLVVSQDSSQYIQNILTTCGLMFAIMVGNTFYFMYQQQESVYTALFDEVSEAKSLLEQLSLVLQGRTSTYESVLSCVQKYVDEDLKCLDVEPSELLSSRPVDDPLASVMFYTSVGEPSMVYDTIRSLRQARAKRLGALQRKLPEIHMFLLYSLGAVVLSTFPVLGAGVQIIGGDNILRVQSVYFGIIMFAIVTALGVINELRKPAGGLGVYNVDALLNLMTQGLDEELQRKLSDQYSASKEISPTVDPFDMSEDQYELSDEQDIGEEKKSIRRRIMEKVKRRTSD